jgi:3-hydroxyacyl-CoA dehydrogenase
MFWAEQSGLARVVDTMRRLAPSHGGRWRPAPLLERLAAAGQGFRSAQADGPARSNH